MANKGSDGWPLLIRDVPGFEVRTQFELTNGLMVIPVGTVGKITGGASWRRLAFQTEPCKCCGVAVRLLRADKYCFEPL